MNISWFSKDFAIYQKPLLSYDNGLEDQNIDKPLNIPKMDTSNDINVQKIVAEKNIEGAKSNSDYVPIVTGILPPEIEDIPTPRMDVEQSPEAASQGAEVLPNNQLNDRSSKMLAMMQKLQKSWTHTELPEIIMFKDEKAKTSKLSQVQNTVETKLENKDIFSTPDTKVSEPQKVAEEPYIHAGEVLYAYNKLEVNSDYGGPVVLVGLDKRIKDAVFIADGYEAHDAALTIHPKTMSFGNQTLDIDAYVLNPSSDATVVASEVDHHYFERWGSFLLVEAVNAYADVATAMGQAKTAAIGGATTVPTVTTTPKFSPSQQGWIIGGKTLGKLSETVAKNLDRPNTVYLHRHDAVAILFMKDIFHKALKGKARYLNIDVNALKH